MGFDKDFIDKVFSSGKDRVNRAIFVKPEELIEISDDDLSYFGEGTFYCLPRNQYIMDHKDEIRKKYILSEDCTSSYDLYKNILTSIHVSSSSVLVYHHNLVCYLSVMSIYIRSINL